VSLSREHVIRVGALIVGAALICIGLIAIAHAQEASSTSPAQETLANLEKTIPDSPLGRFHRLAALARAAYDAGNMTKAQNYSDEVLSSAPNFRRDWAYGDAIFTGNTTLGLVAMTRDRNIPRAEEYLLDSARNNSRSPALLSFGPNMRLPKELLTAGERDVVLEFLGECQSFWKMGHEKLTTWSDTIQSGQIPDFGANVNY
jgi:hypothetical protein